MATSLSRPVSDTDRCLIAEDSSLLSGVSSASLQNHPLFGLMNVAGSADLIASLPPVCSKSATCLALSQGEQQNRSPYQFARHSLRPFLWALLAGLITNIFIHSNRESGTARFEPGSQSSPSQACWWYPYKNNFIDSQGLPSQAKADSRWPLPMNTRRRIATSTWSNKPDGNSLLS